MGTDKCLSVKRLLDGTTRIASFEARTGKGGKQVFIIVRSAPSIIADQYYVVPEDFERASQSCFNRVLPLAHLKVSQKTGEMTSAIINAIEYGTSLKSVKSQIEKYIPKKQDVTCNSLANLPA